MQPLVLLLLGVAIVLGGILALRLHAFLVLTLAALVVAGLTPLASRQKYLADKHALPYEIDGPVVRVKASLPEGTPVVLLRRDEGGWTETAVANATADGEQSMVLKTLPEGFGGTPFQVALPLHAWRAAQREAQQTVGDRVGDAFGSTCGKIGILIALAAVIGKCLLDSGAADRIVRAALAVVGERGAPAAFVFSGFTLGIPVFFDTVFYLLIPLGKATHLRTGKNYLLYILTIVCGATMAHSLVPPTPGPLLVAGELGVDIGVMILGGLLVGSVTAGVGFLYANVVSLRSEVELRESPEEIKQLQEISARQTSDLPPLWLSLLPILLPVVMIAGNTIAKTFDLLGPTAAEWMETLGNKNIALVIAAAIAMLTLVAARRPTRKQLAASMLGALQSGGVIILITAAGGAFGAALQQTGIIDLIRQLPSGSPAAVLTLAFLITTAIRTAQGSATVAMITAVGVLAGFSDPATLGCHPVYLALAIGCGSKPVAWMNDSGFWVICKMSGMTEGEGLRYVTPMSILMGLSGLLVVLIAATLLPLS